MSIELYMGDDIEGVEVDLVDHDHLDEAVFTLTQGDRTIMITTDGAQSLAYLLIGHLNALNR